jgi:membrane fusion protein (multidrug efflux system)
MFARVQVVVATLDDIVTVPRDAVLRLDGDRVVFVVTGGRSYRRAVIVGAELEGKAVITDGVNPGDTVVVVGQSYLEDSLKVNLTSVE